MCQWNVDGMATSLMDLRDLVKRKPATGVILVQESKLLPSDPDPSVPGFSTVRLDRPPSQGGTRGGGLLTFVRQDIPYRQVESFRRGADGAGLEALTVELKTSEGGCVTLTNVYRPPVRDDNQADLGVRALRIPRSDFVIAGDLNAHDPLWDDRQPPNGWGRLLEEWAGDNDLACLNDGDPTRFNRATGGGSAPDISMVHSSLLPRAVWWRHQLLGSDHLPLFFELQVTPWALREDELKLKWNWREADWDAFQREVDQEVDAAVPRSRRWSLKRRVGFLEEVILGSARRNVGMVRVKGEGRSWVTPELRAATKRRNRLGRDINAHRDAWLEACREVRRLTREAKAASWRSYVDSLGANANSSRTWNVLRSLNGAKASRTPRNVVLEHKGKAVVGDGPKADAFVQHYAAVSRHFFTKEERGRDREVRKALTADRRARLAAQPNDEWGDPVGGDFLRSELERALRDSKKKGAPGHDGIAPQFLHQLGDAAKAWLLVCINHSWRTGETPQQWRDATIVPIPKPGKPPGEIASNRPIALTSCIAKLMERMVANRLRHAAESLGLWTSDQAGFRAQRSTLDQVLRLSQSVDDGFQKAKPADRTVLALLDFSRAYVRVWRADLLDCLLKKGIHPRLVRWVKGFLSGWRARVRINSTYSRWRHFKEGVPQG